MSDHPLLVDVAWVEAHRGDPGVVILDATTFLTQPEGDGYYDVESGRAAFEKGHIPGARFADLLHDLADLSAETTFTALDSTTFAERIGALGVSSDSHVVLYDQGITMWATRLWWNLRLEGHDQISVVEGGFAAWREAGYEIETGAVEVESAPFIARRRPELILDKEQVAATIDSHDTLLVNVLDEQTYSGNRQTYDRVGHIPGSVNISFWPLLQQGELGSLREKFDEHEALSTTKRVATYCGSGIAATLVAFDLARLGREDVAVYDGSMTEWAKDADLPLVEGATPR